MDAQKDVAGSSDEKDNKIQLSELNPGDAFKVEEYDLIEKCFTGHRWADKTRECYEKICVRHYLNLYPDDVPERPLGH